MAMLLMVLAFYWAARRLKFKDRAALERYQAEKLARFLEWLTTSSPFYRAHAAPNARYRDHPMAEPLKRFPLMDKDRMMDNFDALNTAGITVKEVLATALAGESSRDFTPRSMAAPSACPPAPPCAAPSSWVSTGVG